MKSLLRLYLCVSLLSAAAALADEYGEPLTASLAVNPAIVQQGQEVELKLTLTVNPSWHVFANTPGAAGQQPLKLKARLPGSIESRGDWKWPKYESLFDGYEINIYGAGEHVFARRLKVLGPVTPLRLIVEMTYQACNPEYCGPIQTEQFTAQLQVAEH